MGILDTLKNIIAPASKVTYVRNPDYNPNSTASNFYVDRSKLTVGLNPVDQKIEQAAGSNQLTSRLQSLAQNTLYSQANATMGTVSPAWKEALSGYKVENGQLVAPTTTQTRTQPGQTGEDTTPPTGVSATGRSTSITAPVQTNPAGTPQATPGQPIDINRLSGEELRSLAASAGQAGLSLTDYIELVNANAQVTGAESDKIRTDLGIEEKRAKLFSQPTTTLEEEYQRLYKTTGLTDIKKKIADVDASLERKRNDFLKVEGDIKNNPWLSSASRRGRLATAASLALTDIGNDLDARQQYLDLYTQGVKEVESKLGYIISDRNLQRELDTEELNYLLNEAERREGLQLSENVTAGLRNVPDFIEGRRNEQLRIEAVEASKIAADAKEVPVLRLDEAGNVVAGSEPPKAPTEGERQTLIFFQRMADAIANLDDVEDAVSKTGLIGQAQMAAFDMPLLLTKNQERYEQAARAFTEARLRKDSGAAIPDTEYEADRKTYFPQPGDSAETLAQKKQSRQVAINGLRVASGNAYWQLYGVNPVEETIARLQGAGAGTGVQPTEADDSYVSKLNLGK